MTGRRCCHPPRLHLPGEHRFPTPRLPTQTVPPTGRRLLALHLPRLVTEGLGPGPLLAWAPQGARRIVVAVDPLAEALGLRPGQALAEAQAIAPTVRAVLVPPDAGSGPRVNGATPAAGRRLAELALWALRFTPLTAPDTPDGLLLDITGAAHLAGGEAALLARIIADLRRLGHEARGAIAGSPVTAAALARVGGGILAPGTESAAIGPLPLAALRLPPETVASLGRLGLRTVREVLAQPRAALTRRFGAHLAHVLDAATGATSPPIRPIRPAPDFSATQDLLEPITTREAIDAVMDRLLPRLCRRLERAGMGLREIVLRAHRADGGVQEINLGTGAATRDPAHLARLFRDRLDRLEPGFGFDRMALLALRTEALEGVQSGFAGAGAERRDALTRLLDRLAQRLPVWRLAPRASHWPERAMQKVEPFATVPAPAAAIDGPTPPRPVRLLRRPEPLEALALLPDAPPSMIRLYGQRHRIRRAEGPERIAPEWWRDAPTRRTRDYYRLECEDGTRLWVCRAGAPGDAATTWLHHGWLA